MTTDEAIEYLKNIDEFICNIEKHMPGCCCHNSEPIEMAIEALQFQQDQKEIDAMNYDREMRDREE